MDSSEVGSLLAAAAAESQHISAAASKAPPLPSTMSTQTHTCGRRRNERERSTAGEKWIALGRAMETSLVSRRAGISCCWPGDPVNTPLCLKAADMKSGREEEPSHESEELCRRPSSSARPAHTGTTSGTRPPSSTRRQKQVRPQSHSDLSAFCFVRPANEHLVMRSLTRRVSRVSSSAKSTDVQREKE